MILAVFILAFLGGVAITSGMVEDSPGAVLIGTAMVSLAGIFVGVLW